MKIPNKRMSEAERVAIAVEWLDQGCKRYEKGNKIAVIEKWQTLPVAEFQNQIRSSALHVGVTIAELKKGIRQYFNVKFYKGSIKP
jgi:hypothetical protein